MRWTTERLEKLSSKERAQLYTNALNAGTSDGEDLAELIRQSGLSLVGRGGITRDHPLIMRMDDIITSDEGQEACIMAVKDGHPALAGVDPMLAQEFPTDYGKHNQTTDWAGHLVADLMRELGYYKADKPKAMPKGCVAKTGEMWKR